MRFQMKDFSKDRSSKKGNRNSGQTNLQGRDPCRGNGRNRQAKTHEDNRILQQFLTGPIESWPRRLRQVYQFIEDNS